MQHFFRKGNLLALRELALRRTADRVDDDVRAYRREKSVRVVWPTRESLLVCVGPGPGGEKLVRNGARMAAQFQMPWHTVYVETPRLQRLPDAERARILRVLKLAQGLGAQTANLAGNDAVVSAIAYAREHNLGKILIGRDQRPRLPWRSGFAERLGRLAADLDMIQIACQGADKEAAERAVSSPTIRRQTQNWRNYLGATLAISLITGFAVPLHLVLDQSNIIMLYLLAVVLTALKLGRGPAVLAAFLAVGVFDFFFVSPRLTFAVGDAQHLVTFAVMLSVALITGQLTAGLSFQAAVAESRVRRTQALYEMARDLSSALTLEQIAEISQRFVSQGFSATSTLLVLDPHDQLTRLEGGTAQINADLGIARWAFDHNQSAGLSTDTLPSAPALYVPLRAPMRTRGVLVLEPGEANWLLTPEQQQLLETSATLTAIALERVHYIAVAQEALIHMESERLRNSLLSALSHDLRTPLTVLVGLADSLSLSGSMLPPAQADIALAIREEALRTSALVSNLLDMARLQTGKVELHREWQPLEEVIGVALHARAALLAQHAVHIDLPADLPLLEFDTVLMERVFCNLLENAAKYTPPGSRIDISARRSDDQVEISVTDNGPGLPPGKSERLFEKFTRGTQEEARIAGVGLGLAIVQAIIEAHRGKVRAENRPDGGARFVIRLPAGEPPALPEEV